MFDRPPHLMKAAQLSALEGPSVLRVADVPVPSDTGRVLIEVRAAGVSYPDLLMTYGKYQKQVPAPFVPGIEIAGVVAAAPKGSAVSVGVAWGEYVRSNPTVFRESVDSLAKLIADGLRPHITARYPLDGAAAALAALERGEIVAKAVLDLS